MQRTWGGFGVGVVAVLLTSCATAKFGVGATVNHVQSPHFDAVGDLPVERLEREVIRFEQLFDVFTTFFNGEPLEHQRLPLVLMRHGEVDEFDESAGGFVGTYRIEPFLVSSVSDDERLFSVNTHELVHLLSSYALPHQPRWFAEGIAGLFQDAHVDRAGSIKMGTWQPVSEWATLDELLEWGTSFKPLADQYSRYETARAVLFYLANRDEPRLRTLIAGLRSRRPSLELEAELFPHADRLAFMQRVKDFIEERRFSAWSTTLVRSADVRRLPPLEPWAVHLTRAKVFTAASVTSGAINELMAGRAVAPSPMPPELAAEILWRDWPAPADVSSPDVQLALGDAIDRSYEEQLQAATAATQARPNVAFGWWCLAGARFSMRDFEGALVALDRAGQLAPQSERVLFKRVDTLLKLRRCAEARAALVTAIGVLESPEWSAVANRERAVRECTP